MKEAARKSPFLQSELHKSAEFKDISPFDRSIRGSLPALSMDGGSPAVHLSGALGPKRVLENNLRTKGRISRQSI
jgi:hypothetical protein